MDKTQFDIKDLTIFILTGPDTIHFIEKLLPLKTDTILPNPYPVKLELLTNTIKEASLCGDEISNEYIEKAVQESSLNLLVEHRPDKKIVGAACLEFQEEDSELYVSLLCASGTKYKGIGTYLINIIKIIKNIFEIETISVNSLLTSMPFYKKVGFNFNNTIRLIYKNSKGGRKNLKSRRIKKSRRQTKKAKHGAHT